MQTPSSETKYTATIRNLPVANITAETWCVWQQSIELTTILEWANLDTFERVWIEAQRARCYAELKCREDGATYYARQPQRPAARRVTRLDPKGGHHAS